LGYAKLSSPRVGEIAEGREFQVVALFAIDGHFREVEITMKDLPVPMRHDLCGCIHFTYNEVVEMHAGWECEIKDALEKVERLEKENAKLKKANGECTCWQDREEKDEDE
jgi:hypothetical protein